MTGDAPAQAGVGYDAVRAELAALGPAARIAFAIYDAQSGRIAVSEGLCDIYGLDAGAAVTREDLRRLIHPDDRAPAQARFEQGIAQHRPFSIEHRVVAQDGRIAWVRREMMPKFAADGRYLGYLAVLQDITDQRRAEEALRAREGELRAILDNAPIAIFLKGRDRRFRLVNRRYEDWFGKRGADMVGRSDREIWPEARAERIEATDSRVLAGEVTRSERPAVDVPADRRDLRHVELTKFPVRDAAGRIEGICGFVRNVTDRKEAEDALRTRERELRAILDNAPVAIFLKDRDRRFRIINRRYEEWFGKREADLIGRTDGDVYDAAFSAMVEASDARVLGGEVVREERPAYTVHPEHPEIRHISVTKFPLRDAAGAVEGICGFVRNVTDRKEAVDALRTSEARFRALIEHSSDLTSVLAPDGTIRYMSPSAREMLGYDPAAMIGRNVREFFADDTDPALPLLAEVAQAPDRRAAGERRVRHADGSWRQLAYTMRNAADVPGIDGIVVNARDVTDGVRLAEQLAQAQKMEAVGQLASGIAHDFNNIVGAILGFAGFLVEDLAPGSEQHRYASRIVQAGGRAREVVQQILTFARRTGIERKEADLRAIAGETVALLRASLPSSTEIRASIAGAPLVAAVNATQISQVLLNLGMNAHDAAGGEPGTIAIALERIPAGASPAADDHPAGPRTRMMQGALDPSCAYARLAVSDSGCGMDEAVLRRIFEPFFTTKPRGRGTGLGLPVVHGIAAAHAGASVIDSAPGHGTTFALFIPLADAQAAADAEPQHAAQLGGAERVLVVDDDADIVDMVTTGLDRLGYECVGIGDAAEALAVYRADPAAWDVVVSDQVMPRLKGLALLEQLRAVNPRVRFILCTGFSDSASEAVARDAGVDAYFTKPVAIASLAAAIRALCGAR